MNEESIKLAFQKAKEDIFSLGSELQNVRQDILDIKTEIKLISLFIEDLKIKEIQQINTQTNQQTDIPTEDSKENSPRKPRLSGTPTHNPAIQHINQAETPIPTDTPTLPHEIGGLISSKTGISTGNGGVPTDKPTDRQTNQQTGLSSINSQPLSLDRAQELLANLDRLRKEVRFKFKRLTSQEMQVFSLLYDLEEKGFIVDYRLISENLKLSESSIRDYIGKIQKKGIPIIKEKQNNKRILLHISPDLKKIASLQTILKLREI